MESGCKDHPYPDENVDRIQHSGAPIYFDEGPNEWMFEQKMTMQPCNALVKINKWENTIASRQVLDVLWPEDDIEMNSSE